MTQGFAALLVLLLAPAGFAAQANDWQAGAGLNGSANSL
jgi:hypothetical protein